MQNPKIITMRTERRMKALQLQRDILQINNQIKMLHEQTVAKEKEFLELVTVEATELEVDTSKYSFDVDKLDYVPKQQPKAKKSKQ